MRDHHGARLVVGLKPWIEFRCQHILILLVHSSLRHALVVVSVFGWASARLSAPFQRHLHRCHRLGTAAPPITASISGLSAVTIPLVAGPPPKPQ
jgi:hypothetical protein